MPRASERSGETAPLCSETPKQDCSVRADSALQIESNTSQISSGRSMEGQHLEQEQWTWMRLGAFFPRWFQLVRGWYTGKSRKQAWLHAIPCVALAILKTFMIVRISYVQRSFSTNLSEKNQEGFYAAALDFVYIILVAAPLFAALGFTTSRLKVMWRKWMTEQLLGVYFKNEAYFQLKMDSAGIDNPDQRICDDIASFTDGSTVVIMTALDKVFQIFAVLHVLWKVSPELVVFIAAYSTIGTAVTVSGFGRQLMHLFYELLHREGDMRFALVRTAENAESIAFYGGASQEHATARERLETLVVITLRRIWWLTGLDLWTNCYSYATILAPSLMIGPRYFRGEVDFGTITQASFLFNRLLDALSVVVDRLGSLCNLAAETDRLHNLSRQLSARPVGLEAIVHKRSQDMHGLRMQDVAIQTPRGALTLASNLSFQVAPGQSLLVMGESGCGKSSIMRAVAGLWTGGAGVIETPQASDLFFLPQKPYMPQGSLRRQLLFPSGLCLPQAGGADPGGWLKSEPSDKDLLELLEEVHLAYLPGRVGGLDADLDWASMLSQGEQQRVAFLRLLLHRPQLAFLDEATSAVDTQIEAELYTALQRKCRCYISIGHRLQLLSYHTHVLLNTGPGKWNLMTTADYKSTASPLR
uniref:Putative ATP-binding cassette transporter n=1 Tax=Tetraselmis sp. GSL018 TaxID=582737 RepID=A0A061R746_9CHLO